MRKRLFIPLLILIVFTGCARKTYTYPVVESFKKVNNHDVYESIGLVALNNDKLTVSSKIYFAKYLTNLGVNVVMCREIESCQPETIILLNASNDISTHVEGYTTPAMYTQTSIGANNYSVPLSGGGKTTSKTMNNTGLSAQVILKGKKSIIYTGTAFMQEGPSSSLDLIEEESLYIVNDWLYENDNYRAKLDEFNTYFYMKMHPNWANKENPLYKQRLLYNN
ncbi:MAG: hypothetical protein ABFS35_22630 [Bacteroidota bacterium]